MAGAVSPMLRRINAQAVLDALLDAGGDLTGSDLMATTGLSRPTVHGVCDDLISRGLAVERAGLRPADASRPGRRARVYEARADAAHVVGVDMGETTVRAAVADLRGRVVGEAAGPFRDARVPARERLDTTRAVTARALAAAGVAAAQVRAAGLAVPAPVSADGHALAADHYLPGLAGVDLRGALAPLISAPALVENDANLAVLAERWLGAATGAGDVVLLLAGERLGAGICVGGRLVRGRGGAGEMGFLHLVDGVGNTDGIGRLTREATSGQRAEDVVAAARRGEPSAREVLGSVATRTARAVAVLATLLDPEVVVVGGAVADAGAALLEPLTEAVHGFTPARPLLTLSTLADRGPLLGAVRIALDDLRPRLLDAVAPPA